jgi:hypothetical protein
MTFEKENNRKQKSVRQEKKPVFVIRIRIRNTDPGGQKLPTKVCFEVLDVLF